MSLRVLLADESSTIKKVFEIGLKDYGIDMKTVQHGIDVLEVAERFKPDIVFADVLISKMNGYEVCSQLKQNSSFSNTPVVLMWSSFMDIDEDKFLTSQADGKLEKPFSSEQLVQIIQNLASRSLASRSSQPPGFGTRSPQSPRVNPADALIFKDDLPGASSDLFSDEDIEKLSQDDELDLEGFQPLDISGSQSMGSVTQNKSESSFDLNSELSDNFDDQFDLGSNEQLLTDNEDDLPFDFSPDLTDENDFSELDLEDELSLSAASKSADAGFFDSSAFGIEKEITKIPSIEEEAQLLQQIKEDTAIRSGINLNDIDDLMDHKETIHRKVEDMNLDESGLKLETPPYPNKNNESENKIGQLTRQEIKDIVRQEARELLQSLVWEIVPDMSKQMIEKEIKRLLADEDNSQDAQI